jgi:alcohol dehydrogenase, propanol-preferring
MMKAAVVHQFKEPLRIEDVPKPEPGPDEAVFKVEAAGLCHTDIHAAHGDWPVKPTLPLIPGHEGVGIVESVGRHVKHLKEGDRVALPWLAYACGTCEHCVSGWETLCLSQLNAGYSVNGSYGEYAKGFGNFLSKVPDGINPYEAAPLTCAGVTTYKAVKAAGVRPSQLVAVFGIGGLGHLAMQYARVAGAAVVAVDIQEDKLQIARELGAEYTVNAKEQDPIEEIQKLGGAHVAVVLAVSPRAFEQAYRSLRRGGTLSMVALPADNDIRLPIFETVLNAIKIQGSIVGTRVDLQEVFELHRYGKTKVLFEKIGLDQVNTAFDSVLQGTNQQPRLVFDMANADLHNHPQPHGHDHVHTHTMGGTVVHPPVAR